MAEQRPTAESIDELYAHLTQSWSKAHNNWRTVDDYYHRRFQVWKRGTEPEQRSQYIPSKATNIIDHAADTQLAYEPRVHRFPTGRADNRESRADSVEKGLKAVLDNAALFEMSLPWKQIGRHLLHYGYAIAEGPVLDWRNAPDSLGDDEQPERFWNPVRIRAIHPTRVLLDPMEKQPEFAIKKSRIYYSRLQDLLTRASNKGIKVAAFDGKKKGPWDQVDIIEYWSKKYHAIKVTAGNILWVEANTWGFIPFSHAFAGFGMEPADEQQYDPSYLAVGLLWPVLDGLKLSAQRMSAQHTLLMDRAYAARGTTGDPSEVAEQMARGEFISGEKGSVWVVEANEVNSAMLQVGMEVDRDIEQGTYSKSLAGMKEPGISTVGQQAILSTAAQRKFASPAIQLQHMASVVSSNTLRLVSNSKRIGGVIGADGHFLRATDIGNDYNVKTTFEVVDPILELQRRELGMREVQMDLKSDTTYWEEDARREDISGERVRLIQMKVRNAPGVIAALAAEEARQMGLEKELADAMDVEATVPGGPNGRSVIDEVTTPQVRRTREGLTPNTAKPPLMQQPPE